MDATKLRAAYNAYKADRAILGDTRIVDPTVVTRFCKGTLVLLTDKRGRVFVTATLPASRQPYVHGVMVAKSLADLG